MTGRRLTRRALLPAKRSWLLEKSRAVRSPKEFLERLVAEGRVAGGGGEKLRAFLAHDVEIHGALQAGYSVKDVWESLRQSGEVDLSYPLFSQYVKMKLKLEPKRRFEKVEVVSRDKPAEAELSEGDKAWKKRAGTSCRSR